MANDMRGPSASDRSPVGVEALRCVRSVVRTHPCRACAEACPVGAVDLAGGAPRITAACQACGACVAACPAGALQDRLRPDRELAALGRRDHGPVPRVVLTCEALQDPPPDARRLPCLGRLTAGVILGLFRSGAARIEILRPDCAACRWARAGTVLGRTLRTVEVVLEVADIPRDAVVVSEVRRAGSRRTPPPPPTPTPPVAGPGTMGPADEMSARRGFLWNAARGLGALLAAAVPAVPLGWLPGADPRAHLIGTLRGLGCLQGRSCPADAVPFARIHVDAGCDACGACERVCPAAALSVDRYPGGGRVRFRPLRCWGCGSCEKACLPGALRVASEVDLAWVLEAEERIVAELEGAACAVCGRLVRPGQGTCGPCTRPGGRRLAGGRGLHAGVPGGRTG